jgi:hypothetical protein
MISRGTRPSAYPFSRLADGFRSKAYRFCGNEYGLERTREGFGPILYSFWRSSSSLGKTLPVLAKICTGLAPSREGFARSWYLGGQTGTFSRKICTSLGRRCHVLDKRFPVFGKRVQLFGVAGDALAVQFRRKNKRRGDPASAGPVATARDQAAVSGMSMGWRVIARRENNINARPDLSPSFSATITQTPVCGRLAVHSITKASGERACPRARCRSR